MLRGVTPCWAALRRVARRGVNAPARNEAILGNRLTGGKFWMDQGLSWFRSGRAGARQTENVPGCALVGYTNDAP
jgi:hypothetical protein